MRYDGIYRIVKCWRTKGKQGFLMCRYLFVRADNEPAPWSSEGARALVKGWWGVLGDGQVEGCNNKPAGERSTRHPLSPLPFTPPPPPPLSPPSSPPPTPTDTGDRPGLETNLPKEALEEVKKADGGKVYSMGEAPWWGWDADKAEWGWARDAPVTQARGDPSGAKATRKKVRGGGGAAARPLAVRLAWL